MSYPEDRTMARLEELENEQAEASKIDRPTVANAITYTEDRLERLTLQIDQLEALLQPVLEPSVQMADRDRPTEAHPGPPVARRVYDVGHRVDALANRIGRLQTEVAL